MLLHGANDGMLCLAFSATLRKAVRQLFSILPPRSISSFEQLERLFISYFISNRRQRYMSDMLIRMKQRKNESLQKFITRFNTATLEMTDLDQMVTMSAMKGTLKPSRFLFSLEKKFSTSFFEILFRTKKYTNIEEAFLARKTSAPGPSDKGKGKEREKDKRKKEEPPSNDSSAQVRGSPKSPSPRFHNYTSLNALRSPPLQG